MTKLLLEGSETGVSVVVANTWLSRLVGLLSRKGLTDKESLLLQPCASIHTIGMRFDIDAVFLDKDGKVLRVAENLKPMRFCFAPKYTAMVLELASGNAKRTGINLEHMIKFD